MTINSSLPSKNPSSLCS